MAVFDITRIKLEGIERELKRFNDLVEMFLQTQFGLALFKQGIEPSSDDDSEVSFVDEEADAIREEFERQGKLPRTDD